MGACLPPGRGDLEAVSPPVSIGAGASGRLKDDGAGRVPAGTVENSDQLSDLQCGHVTVTRFHEDFPQNARLQTRHLCGSV
ncbi:hypothetical protein GOALK_120_00490 [Gordonia alkanivorans NBRC 16433]|uniref:Uncharacterized protein n=1 Tax=Gordonia alkanivorans NBRC 16433 TaxID=1027371 RepID=F9W2A3_9ACTN|nr:hypothetical protein GOALK_120_00490 [Gordonia alkanivorans NBRC 16433]